MHASRESKTRILVLRGVDGAGGGADEIILRNAQCLDRGRFDMRLCFLRHAQDPDFTFEERCADLGLDYAEVLHSGPFDLTTRGRIKRIIQEFQPDIVHSHDYKASFHSRALAKSCGYRTLATSHGWTGSRFRERRIYYPADKLVLRKFDRVVAVSEDIRQQLIRFGRRRRKSRSRSERRRRESVR